MMTAIPLFGPIPGGPEMLVILLLAVLLFGANKIPKLARSTGTAIGEFRKGRKQVEQELQEMEDASDPTTDVAESSSDNSTDQERESADGNTVVDSQSQADNMSSDVQTVTDDGRKTESTRE